MWWSLVSAGLAAASPAPSSRDLPDHPTGSVAEVPSNAGLVWQGFDHHWERRALGLWSLPHRVSLFQSGPIDVVNEATEDGVVTRGDWRFGQAPGVDGDHMRPVGYGAHLTAPNVEMYAGTSHHSTVDQLADPTAPRTFARFHDVLRIPAGNGPHGHAVGLVRGLSFRSRCMDAPDRCNSDGIWPYRFLVSIAPCEHLEGEWVCPVTVELGRAWTPGRGGVKYLEEKPINERMAIDIDIDWVVLEGSTDALASTTVLFENAVPRDKKMRTEEQSIPVPAVGGDRYPAATVGLSSFGFVFYPTGARTALEQRGRYLSGWSMHVRELGYDPATGLFEIGHSGGISMTRTVKNTGVGLELGMTVVQLGAPDARVTELPPLEGVLCADSEGAPRFSSWNRCARVATRSGIVDRVPFEVASP